MPDPSRTTGAAPPLRILVLFHPQSEIAPELARDLYRRFMVLGGGPGLRIPVQFGAEQPDGGPPPPPAFDEQTRTLVVALIDGRMARSALDSDKPVATAWAALVHGLITTIDTKPGSHGILPVAIDGGAFDLDERLANYSFVRLDVYRDTEAEAEARVRDLEFQVAIAALQLLQPRKAVIQPRSVAPITVFVSHAKSDTPHENGMVVEGPIDELLSYLAQNPVEGWFDHRRIKSGTRFDEAIREGVTKSNVVVCVLTDHWSDREWCRREALYAKRHGIPIVVVDALSDRAERLFPYLGNAPMLRWRPGAARSVVLAAMLEALRRRHACAVLELRKGAGDHVFGAQPESLTLRRLPETARRVLYPDPPLPLEELDEISPLVALDDNNNPRSFELTTPLSELARWKRPDRLDLVGLSISDAQDIGVWGASTEHLGTLADDLATMLLVAGIRLAYGGVIDHAGTRKETNFASRLFGLVRSYFPKARQLGASRFHPIENYVPWPKHLAYGHKELAVYGKTAEPVFCPRPTLNATDGDLGFDAKGALPLVTTIQRWAYARGLTAMRERMTGAISARVAVGGRLEGYTGVLPGVLEEILIARCGATPKPLYLLGAFGGAARLAIDLLEGRKRLVPRVSGHDDLVAEYRARGDSFQTPEEAAQLLRTLGQLGPEKALDNGLDDEQNRELFETPDSYRIVELILIGMRARWPA
ncbi:MAG TPA: TIR domain-containing protein [Kofleriaceae bacterium]|nr:TIR domain-containing protein [Kofleriaceae bacterium]